MPSRTSVRFLLCLLALSFTSTAFAQFKDPTPEELKMTSDPKAPGAAAVYLDFDDHADDQFNFRSVYARIKILQEKGKELATVEVMFSKRWRSIVDIKGRTIHPDGTIVPLTGKPDELLVVKKGFGQVDKKVFNLPSVEVGSIIEYSYQINTDDRIASLPDWTVQRPYFVHHARYFFRPYKNFTGFVAWAATLPTGVTVAKDALDQYSLEVTDVPAAPNEEWMPPMPSFNYKVDFYYQTYQNSAEFWDESVKDWSKEVDKFAEPSKHIRNAVEGIVAETDTPLDKAKKIYKAVQALDNTDFSRVKSASERKQLKIKDAKHAENTWTEKSGSRQDIALLYLAMVRAAGLEAYDAKVVNRDEDVFVPSFLTLDQFDDDLVILKIDEKEMVVDPGEKMCPFQSLNWKHSAASGIRQSKNNLTSATTTPYQQYAGNTLFRSADFTLDPQGQITGTIRITVNGQEALRWRQEALRNDLDEVKKSFDRWLTDMVPEGVEAHVDKFTALDDPYQKLIADINVKGALGASTAKRLLLPGLFFETRGSHPFVDQEKRTQPVDMHYGDAITDQVVYHLPAGLNVEAAPQDSKTPWEGKATLIVKSRNDPGQITVARQLVRAFTILKPEEYQDLRAFYQKVAAADQQQLILTSGNAAKGN